MMIMKIWLPARMQEPKRCCYSSLVANDCTVSFFVSQSLSVMQTSTAVTFEVSNHSQRLGSPTTPTPLQLQVHSPPVYNFWFTPHPSTSSGHSPPQQYNAATPQKLCGGEEWTGILLPLHPTNLSEPTSGEWQHYTVEVCEMFPFYSGLYQWSPFFMI